MYALGSLCRLWYINFITFAFSFAETSGVHRKARECGITPTKPEFTPGETEQDAKPYSFPWTALLCQHGSQNSTGWCSYDSIGSIVQKRWILGPYEANTSRVMFVKVGINDANHRIESGVQLHSVDRQVNCPCKAFTLYRIGTGVIFMDHVRRVCLSSSDILGRKNGSEAVLVGWSTRQTPAQNVHQIRVNVTTWAKLPSAYGIMTNYSANMVDGSLLLQQRRRRLCQYGFSVLDFHPAYPFADITRLSPLCKWFPALTDGEVKYV